MDIESLEKQRFIHPPKSLDVVLEKIPEWTNLYPMTQIVLEDPQKCLSLQMVAKFRPDSIEVYDTLLEIVELRLTGQPHDMSLIDERFKKYIDRLTVMREINKTTRNIGVPVLIYEGIGRLYKTQKFLPLLRPDNGTIMKYLNTWNNRITKMRMGVWSLYKSVTHHVIGITYNDCYNFLRVSQLDSLHKTPPMKVILTQPLEPLGPHRHFQLDTEVYNKMASDGKHYMLLLIDIFTKHLWTWSMNDKTSERVWFHAGAVLLEEFMIAKNEWGVTPQEFIVHTDNGSEFMKDFLSHVTDQGWTVRHGVPYNPRAQGCVERVGKTIKTYLFGALTMRGDERWNRELEAVTHNYNENVHSVTKYRPSFLAELTKTKTPQSIPIVESLVQFYHERAVRMVEGESNGMIPILKHGSYIRVRLSNNYKVSGLEKGYVQNYSKEIYEIINVWSREKDPDTGFLKWVFVPIDVNDGTMVGRPLYKVRPVVRDHLSHLIHQKDGSRDRYVNGSLTKVVNLDNETQAELNTVNQLVASGNQAHKTSTTVLDSNATTQVIEEKTTPILSENLSIVAGQELVRGVPFTGLKNVRFDPTERFWEVSYSTHLWNQETTSVLDPEQKRAVIYYYDYLQEDDHESLLKLVNREPKTEYYLYSHEGFFLPPIFKNKNSFKPEPCDVENTQIDINDLIGRDTTAVDQKSFSELILEGVNYLPPDQETTHPKTPEIIPISDTPDTPPPSQKMGTLDQDEVAWCLVFWMKWKDGGEWASDLNHLTTDTGETEVIKKFFSQHEDVWTQVTATGMFVLNPSSPASPKLTLSQLTSLVPSSRTKASFVVYGNGHYVTIILTKLKKDKWDVDVYDSMGQGGQRKDDYHKALVGYKSFQYHHLGLQENLPKNDPFVDSCGIFAAFFAIMGLFVDPQNFVEGHMTEMKDAFMFVRKHVRHLEPLIDMAPFQLNIDTVGYGILNWMRILMGDSGDPNDYHKRYVQETPKDTVIETIGRYDDPMIITRLIKTRMDVDDSPLTLIYVQNVSHHWVGVSVKMGSDCHIEVFDSMSGLGRRFFEPIIKSLSPIKASLTVINTDIQNQKDEENIPQLENSCGILAAAWVVWKGRLSGDIIFTDFLSNYVDPERPGPTNEFLLTFREWIKRNDGKLNSTHFFQISNLSMKNSLIEYGHGVIPVDIEERGRVVGKRVTRAPKKFDDFMRI